MAKIPLLHSQIPCISIKKKKQALNLSRWQRKPLGQQLIKVHWKAPVPVLAPLRAQAWAVPLSQLFIFYDVKFVFRVPYDHSLFHPPPQPTRTMRKSAAPSPSVPFLRLSALSIRER